LRLEKLLKQPFGQEFVTW